jgi:SpoVK/Ycf46/Vps4 family AAA+-type ATPase
MIGPPGCGKTRMARIAAAELQRVTGRPVHFEVVKPGEFESSWVGETEKNIRRRFADLRAAAQGGLSVLFLDEIDAIGRTRGGRAGQHADGFLAALLAEIDGFESLGRVAVVSATNRVDLLDPALLSRLGEVQIQVGRPGMQAAREIFSVHMSASVPMDPGGSRAAATRQEIIETAASLIYAPNAQNEICELQLRDGELRTVGARDLISGRTIEQIATDARFRAFLRECGGGRPGVSPRDMAAAVDCALDRLSATITVHNARDHLADLPEDVPVARVTSLRGRLAEPSRFWSTP